MIISIGFFVLGVILLLLGRWGARRAPELLAERLDAEELVVQKRVHARGSFACQVVGLLFLAGAVLHLLW
jgi:hypothetical protein